MQQTMHNELELNSVQVSYLEFHWLNLSPSSFLFSLTLFNCEPGPGL